MREFLLPHFEERKSQVEMIVLHCSALSLSECIKVWNEYGVAPHYLIDETGEIIKLVDEDKKAFHAGNAFWNGCRNINDISIGIELLNHTMGQEDGSYTETQIASLVDLCHNLMKKYNIKPSNIVGHSDVAPCRKSDPGRAFPWKKLAEEGIGIWYAQQVCQSNDVERLLQEIGYDVCDEETKIASAYAFLRHYMPEKIKIVSDLQELLDNPYPKGDMSWLDDKNFLSVLNAVRCNKR